MKIGDFDTSEKVMIVAEIGNNHEGNVDLAAKMVELAAEAGADAVKFQTLRADRLVGVRDQARYQRLRQFELSYAEFESLADHADRCGVLFLSTPFDLESARFLNDLCPAIKIASSDNNFVPLLDTVARFDKPILLSTGAADLERVAKAKSLIESQWSSRCVNPGLILLHCVSAYPTPAEEANLAAIRTLRETFGCRVGYSDHTLGIEAPVIAAACGAQVIEKHFTIDKHHSEFRDHQLSADPHEMRQLVRRVNEVCALLGDGVKRVQPSERAIAAAVQRRIVAATDLEPGTEIAWEHLNWVRSPAGLLAGEEPLLLGRVVKRHIAEGQPLELQHCRQPDADSRRSLTTSLTPTT